MAKRYVVTVRQTHTFTLEVEADDPDEARTAAAAEMDLGAGSREPDCIDTDMEDWDIEELQSDER